MNEIPTRYGVVDERVVYPFGDLVREDQNIGVARRIKIRVCEKGLVKVAGVNLSLFHARAQWKGIVIAETAATACNDIVREKDEQR